MVRFSILPAAAVTLFLFGAEASPCKPSTTAVTSVAETSSTAVPDSTATSFDSTAIPTLIDATTTVQEEESATTIETSVAESASAIASVVVTTSTALAESTTAAQEEPATTTGAAACVETQLFVNPGFDDNLGDITPWAVTNGVTTTNAQSAPVALTYSFTNGLPAEGGIVSQTLNNLHGSYEFSYYYRVAYVSQGADYVCNSELRVGDTSVNGGFYDTVGGWRFDSVSFPDINVAQADVKLIVTCYGEFVQIKVNIDSLGFKRICSQ
ncbi:hypothetical protein ACHAPO_007361 [Fusarium lateritium]